jgi:hypothetical protein
MMMSKYHSKISQKATYLRVYEDNRMLYGEEVTDIIHKFEKRIVELESIMFDLLSLSSFAMSFPFEYDKLEALRDKT